MKTLRHILLVAAFAILPTASHALDGACTRVHDASIKRMDMPAFHQKTRVGTFEKELLKANGKLYQRQGGQGWSAAALSLDQFRAAVRAPDTMLQSCKSLGRDTTDGVATEVIAFVVKDPTDGRLITSKVWIGVADGLPYLEEGPTVHVTTIYRGIKAPV